MQLSLSLDRPTHVEPSQRVLRVAAMFGLGVDESRRITIVPHTQLELRAGMLIFITGPSGGGKSSLLHLIAQAAATAINTRIISFDSLPELEEVPIVDALLPGCDDAALPRVLELLSIVGLADAFVILRKPGELSDGQRYRLRLAQCIAACEHDREKLHIILADEFGATLDRITAMVIARNLRKWTRRSSTPVCFIAATTHDDLLEALEPDVVIEKGLGAAMEVAVGQGDDGATPRAAGKGGAS